MSGTVWGELVECSLLWMRWLHVQQVLGGPQLVDVDDVVEVEDLNVEEPEGRGARET